MRCLHTLLVLRLFAQQIAKDRVLGEKFASDIKQESKTLEDPTALSYVRSVGERLVANLDNSPYPFSF
jgi:predicted Zn-dependent protease